MIANPVTSNAGELTPNLTDDIKTCENKLIALFTPKYRVTWPGGGGVIKADCPGGDPFGNSASIDLNIPKALFAAGVAPPNTVTIESATQDRIEDSGGPSFRFGYDANHVEASVSCSSGSFGGGVTGSFRITVVLRELMTDARARHIGRMCSAWALSPGEPR